MGIGELHKEHDKEGQEVDVYDVVIHPDFLRKCEKSSFFKEFFVMLVFDGLADKYSLELNREYKLLKNRKSIGTLTTQNVSTIIFTCLSANEAVQWELLTLDARHAYPALQVYSGSVVV